MSREWFLFLDESKVGPYSMGELKRHPRFTPDTLVWKKGFKKWVRAGDVKELKKVFQDEEIPEPKKENSHKDHLYSHNNILVARLPPRQVQLWIFLIILILLYSIWRLYFFP